MEFLYLAAGLAVGAAVGWLMAALRASARTAREQQELASRLAAAEGEAALLRGQRAESERALASARVELEDRGQQAVRAQAQAEAMEKRLAEKERLLGEWEARLRESFTAISAQTLQSNAQQFLSEAKKTLDVVLAEAKGDLGKREEAIKGLVTPVAESLRQFGVQVQSIERARESAYGTLQEQLRQLGELSRTLHLETRHLVSALRDPKVRGRWGELALRRAVELAGMTEHCDFEQQISLTTEDARQRPDLVVRLPGGRSVVVDAKAVLDAYLDAVAATDEEGRQSHLKRHAAQVRSRVKELSGKAYWDGLGSSPEFVVLFLPGEAFFSAAVEADPGLLEDAIAGRVVLASPTTLIALFRAVAHGWRQAQMIENADRISTLGRELHDRLRTFVEHLGDVGNKLGGTVASYNKAVASLESRVLVSGRKLAELGAGSGDELPSAAPVDAVPRLPQAAQDGEATQ